VYFIQDLNPKRNEMIIRFEDSLSHRIKIERIVPIIEINEPMHKIMFHDRNVSVA